MDLVSRKWLTEIVSVEETSTQVAQVFTAALTLEGLHEAVAAYQDTLVDPTVDDPAHPIRLAVSDNGQQMTSHSTRAFMALSAIGQHFGRPGTPTDQAWIETLFGHIRAEWPHLLTIGEPAVLRFELAVVRAHCNAVRLHAGIGYVHLKALSNPKDNRDAFRGDALDHGRRRFRGLMATAEAREAIATLAARASYEVGAVGRFRPQELSVVPDC